MGPGDSVSGRKKGIPVIKSPTWCYCIFMHTYNSSFIMPEPFFD